MKLLSVEMAYLLGIQNEIQAVWVLKLYRNIENRVGLFMCCFSTEYFFVL